MAKLTLFGREIIAVSNRENFCISIFGYNIFTFFKHYIMELEEKKPVKASENVDIREISCGDFEALEKLGGFDIGFIKKLKKKYDGKISGVIALLDGVPAGYAWISKKGARDRQYVLKHGDYLIFDVYVSEKYRGKGIAPLMIGNLTEKFTSKNGREKVLLAVRENNYSAIRAYEKTGFKKVSKKRFCRVLKINIPQIYI